MLSERSSTCSVASEQWRKPRPHNARTVIAKENAVRTISRRSQQNGSCQMKRSMLGSIAAAAVTISVATASAQLSPDQQGALRVIIIERLAAEMQDTLPD